MACWPGILYLHGDMPAEMFFRRPVNTPQSYEDVESAPMTEDELEARVAVMMDLVYPSVFERSRRKHALVAKRANKKRRAKPVSFKDGCSVMIWDVVRGSKTEPYWLGPYKVSRNTRGGA